MKKIMMWFKKNMNERSLLALSAFSLFFATVAANTRCICHYHQPKFPESARQLRKK